MNQMFSGIAQCPYCLLPYGEDSLNVIKKEKKRHIFHVFCHHCQHAMLFSVYRKQSGLVCTGLLTDCGLEDVGRLIGGEKISVDDVLDAHRALQFDNFLEMR